MYDYEIDDDAKVIIQAMKDKTESVIFDKYVKKYKTRDFEQKRVMML